MKCISAACGITHTSAENSNTLPSVQCMQMRDETLSAHPEIFFSTMRMRGDSSSAFMVFGSVTK